MKNKLSEYYGIVEGFFSEPYPIWSKKERHQTIKYVSQNAENINTYLYCPKDDEFVTKQWDKLYPG